MDTRVIGIDLAVKASHKAIVLDQASNSYVGKLLTFGTEHPARQVCAAPNICYNFSIRQRYCSPEFFLCN